MILAILQARMSSSRLPGKALLPVLGKPVLFFLLERLARSRKIDQTVVATSVDPSDDALCAALAAGGWKSWRGSLEDVLGRFHGAAREGQAKHVVRLTGDNPLVDPAVVDAMIDFYLDGKYEYVSNGWKPPRYPLGLGAEIFSMEALEIAARDAASPYDREHVTPFIRESGRFRCGSFPADRDYAQERWTVDHPEDWQLVKAVIEGLHPLNPGFGLREILAYRAAHPEIFRLNECRR